MKTLRISLPFLCLLLMNGLLNRLAALTAQNIQDSTSTYYQSIIEIKDVAKTARAFDFFERASKKALENNDYINAAYNLELISLGQFKMGLYYESEATTIEALNLLNQLDNANVKEPKKRLNNQLGMLYRKIKDYNNAMFFYKKALELDTSLIDKIAIITNIANLEADQDHFQNAVNQLLPFYSQAMTVKDSNIKANYFDNLGYYQTMIGDPNGLLNMKMALKIRERLKDLIGLFSSYRHLALYYDSLGNKSKVQDYVGRVKYIADTINSPLYKLEAMKLGLEQYDNLEFKEYIDLSNAIESQRITRENNYAAIKYNINETEKKFKESQLEIEEQKRLSLMYFFSGLTLLLLLVFLYFYLKTKHKKDRLLQVYNTEKRISKKIHDEVANDVYQVMSKLQSDVNNEEDFLDDLEHIYNKTRDISKENESINLDEDFGMVLENLFQDYNNDRVQVLTKNLKTINWSSTSNLKKTALYRVLQELMTNMKKHSKASFVVISFEKIQGGLMVTYTDNGIGCDFKKQSGLKNTENRIQDVNGTITFESEPENGFKAKITL
ncbi:tetratricopeptide repeat-containing sensor histidine kinase [Seonamhaeicola aphaedonensis]|uniref:Tetratricopeptide repeat protein n=1 Tax=Seonamhaeicola aphaedonensis TaxID=1461338 RepID=A0A3D9HM57_9FLAO|nr:ATP-binding protein [Seonamhaeicola aphaedonensis]RED50564.1 tetratricopeptide repeat protein [Seonamhaeicola aphaedonensis]